MAGSHMDIYFVISPVEQADDVGQIAVGPPGAREGVHNEKHFFHGKELRLDDTAEVSFFHKLISYFKKIRMVRKLKRDCMFDLTIGTDHSSIFVDFLSGGRAPKVGIFHRQLWRPAQEPIFSKKFLTISVGILLVFPCLSRLIAVSRTVERSLRQCYWGLLNRKIRLAYNVVDELCVLNHSQEELSEWENHIFEKDVIVCVGRIDRNKNPMRLVKAFSILPAKLREVSNIVFIGNTQNQACFKEVESFVRGQGLADSVFFLGERENPYPFIKQAKVLVSSSLSEGLPTVLIEALLLNTPIISTNSSEGVWEILSCESDYNPKLSGIFKADKGIITSNISAREDCLENNKTDIKNLSLAMEYVLERENICNAMSQKKALFKERKNSAFN